MVLLLVYPGSKPECGQGVAQREQMELRGGNGPLQHDFPEVADIDIDRIQQEQLPPELWKAVDAVKNCGHIHEQQGKNAVQVLDVPEKYVQRRQDQPDPQVEEHQTDHRVDQQNKFPGDGDSVNDHKEGVNQQRNAEIDEGRDVFGEQEQIFGYIHLGENLRVVQQRGHPFIGGVTEKGKDQLSGEEVNGVVLDGGPQKRPENQVHHQQR